MTCTGTNVCACEVHLRKAHAKEVAQLKALVRELLGAVQIWADSKDDLALEELCERARAAGQP